VARRALRLIARSPFVDERLPQPGVDDLLGQEHDSSLLLPRALAHVLQLKRAGLAPHMPAERALRCRWAHRYTSRITAA
jgi:hypothetical protein